MKVICDRGALVESLNLVSGAIQNRTPKPVLACVKLAAVAGSLTLSTSDTELSIRVVTLRVDVQEPGEALLSFDKLLQIVRESTDPTLTLQTDAEKTIIRGEDSRFEVYGYAPTEFPNIPDFAGEPDFQIEAGLLHRLITQTLFATARENSRYAINGVLVERTGNKLAVVATDGRRLALARGACKATKPDPDAISLAIVPSKALTNILKLFVETDQQVKVRFADNQILFATESALLSSNLVEGNFPPYKDVIPRDGDKKATIGSALLASGVRRAALLTNEESKGVKLSFSADGLTLTSRAPEMGEAEIHVKLAHYAGEPIDIGFNPTYVLDALKVVDTEEVTIEFKAPNKPGVLRTSTDFLYVIMPVSLQ